MSTKPLVSGIIIFLNAERFLEEAIESVIVQTYENWELMLVDDGSNDSSSEIARRYAQQYPEKILYLEHKGHKNLGKSASRNLGFSRSKGEYIAFLDADDVWLPYKLEQQVPILLANPEAGLMYGRTEYWHSWQQHPKPFHPNFLTKSLPISVNQVVEPAFLPLLLFLQNQHIYPCTCSVLVRRQVFEKVGGFEENFRLFNEDMVFYSKIFLQGIPAYISSECWDRYRQHEGSSWAITKKQDLYCPPWHPHPAWLKYMRWVESYFRTQKIKDQNLWKALERNLWPSRHPVLSKLVWVIYLRPILLTILIGRRIIPSSLRHWLWASGRKFFEVASLFSNKDLSKSATK